MAILSGRRAAQHRYALVLFARDAHRAGVEVPAGIPALIEDLTEVISEVGNAKVERETMDGMRNEGTPDEVGREVGFTGRRVRQLCADGLVAHRRIGGGRLLVDVDDLQRYLRERAA